MKKLFLFVAFTGIVGATSASAITTFSKTSIVSVCGDDKKGDDKKKKDEKACCKKDAGGKTCSHDAKDGKVCCKGKAGETAGTAPSTAKPAAPAAK